jgi:tRNA pseudouridine38-40 synthase
MRIALGIEYDGSRFQGWQFLGAHRDIRTIQGELQPALTSVAAHDVELTCAGRTDAGVHAWGQVAHFDTTARRDERAWVLGANSLLRDDVSVVWACEVDAKFHARHSATARRYRYVILNDSARSGVLSGRVSWDYRPLDVQAMQAAANSILGEHDFSAYRAAECQSESAVRDLRQISVRRLGVYILIDVEANAFLQHMVRNIVGVLSDIGAGKRPPGWAREVLESRDRRQGGVTAPAAGLYLLRVVYPEGFAIPEPRAAWWPETPA